MKNLDKATAMQGIDISHYQQNIDLEDAVKNGAKICYLKASEGERTPDVTFPTLYKRAKAAGLKVGAYHFFHVGGGYSTKKQAEHYLRTVKDMDMDCLHVIDIEDGGFHGATKAEVTAEILTFNKIVKDACGENCMLYSNTSFIKEHMNADVKILPLWVAHYYVEYPGDNGIYDEYAGFQYTDKGSCKGAPKLDMNWFSDAVFFKGSEAPDNPAPVPAPTPAPAPKPAPKPEPENPDVYKVSSRPYDWNATARVDFDVRDSKGNAVSGRQVYNGDRITIISVNYDRQLAEIVYPVSSGYMHGYIRNLQTLISDRWHFDWRNGRTVEPVYDADGKRIGTIYPWEFATPLYKKGGRIGLLYNTLKGLETKFGFVNYRGGFKGF